MKPAGIQTKLQVIAEVLQNKKASPKASDHIYSKFLVASEWFIIELNKINSSQWK